MSELLTPKISNRFIVRLSCAFDGTDVKVSDAAQFLEDLSAQVHRVKLPDESFAPCNGGPGSVNRRLPAPFIEVQSDGLLEIEFEDDITNQVQRALDFLRRADVSRITVLVMKLDSASSVREAYVFGATKLIRVKHSDLDYAQNTALRKTLGLTPYFTLRATFDAGAASISQITKLSGV